MKKHGRFKCGDRVQLCGRKPRGIIKRIGKDPSWISVEWDKNSKGPEYVHAYEIVMEQERTPSDASVDALERADKQFSGALGRLSKR